ncbi:unnamed protein product [Clonostachys rhizophaga]|uniref:Uncharacterized protein n=1 Tax=Clonostachys rhizophaga TaxID=160324 RepID=A0A9N9YTJ3_9HYPO|nr:unnamed protein product [Clonostachys rhizophaga]
MPFTFEGKTVPKARQDKALQTLRRDASPEELKDWPHCYIKEKIRVPLFHKHSEDYERERS